VGSKLAPILAAVVLAGLAVASSAAAVGLDDNRVVAAPHRAAAPSAGPLIAPPAACPGEESLTARASSQERAMGCMVDFARRQLGLGELADAESLQQSALDKSADILSCDSFSHFACGREFTYWMKATGYMSTPCWHVGENLAWGTGEYGNVRSIFIAWMRSPAHRENLLGSYDETGISLLVGDLGGQPGTRVWAEHFGTHCG
jgi:uncharacterized protein YkwD